MAEWTGTLPWEGVRFKGFKTTVAHSVLLDLSSVFCPLTTVLSENQTNNYPVRKTTTIRIYYYELVNITIYYYFLTLQF